MHRTEYIKPEVEDLVIVSISVICASPENGGSEDIGFEDWRFE